jgi:hypothetical protein
MYFWKSSSENKNRTQILNKKFTAYLELSPYKNPKNNYSSLHYRFQRTKKMCTYNKKLFLILLHYIIIFQEQFHLISYFNSFFSLFTKNYNENVSIQQHFNYTSNPARVYSQLVTHFHRLINNDFYFCFSLQKKIYTISFCFH